MGRKSLALARKTQILDAFEECIYEYGLEGSTLQRISEAAGVQLSMIPHYFGNREGMVNAMITRFIDTYQRDFEAMLKRYPPQLRLPELIELYFGEAYSHYRPKDAIIITELMGLAERDPTVKQQLREMFQLYEDIFCREVQQAYPTASTESCQKAAHIIIALWYGNATFLWLGFDQAKRVWAREVAMMILGRLDQHQGE